MYLVVLKEEGDFGSPWDLLGINILGNNERGTRLRFQSILVMVIMLSGEDNLLSNQISRVEANTQMINQI